MGRRRAMEFEKIKRITNEALLMKRTTGVTPSTNSATPTHSQFSSNYSNSCRAMRCSPNLPVKPHSTLEIRTLR